MLSILENDLNQLCDEQPFHTGWYVRNLYTGDNLQRHGDVDRGEDVVLDQPL